MCSVTTRKEPDAGRILEPKYSAVGSVSWGAERTGPDAHRGIIKSNASWGGSVYQKEYCLPTFYDEFNVALTFNELLSRDPVIWPLVDSGGQAWQRPPQASIPVGEDLAYFEMDRANVTIIAPFTIAGRFIGSPVTFQADPRGIVFRYSSINDYYRVTVTVNASDHYVLTAEHVSGSSATTLGSVIGGLRSSYPGYLWVTVDSGNLTAGVGQTPGTPLLTLANASGNATLHGLWKKDLVPSDIQHWNSASTVVGTLAYANTKKGYFSVYGPPTPIAMHNDDHYLSVSQHNSSHDEISSGEGALWSGVGLDFVAFTFGTRPFGNGGGAPPLYDVYLHEFQGPDIIRHSELDAGSATWVSQLTSETFSSGGGLDGSRPITIYDFILGKKILGVFGKHSWPTGIGYSIDSVEITGISEFAPSPASDFTFVFRGARATYSIVVGDVDWEGPIPYISAGKKIRTFTTDAWYPLGIHFTGFDFDPGDPPTDDEMRRDFRLFSITGGFGQTTSGKTFVSLPGGGTFFTTLNGETLQAPVWDPVQERMLDPIAIDVPPCISISGVITDMPLFKTVGNTSTGITYNDAEVMDSVEGPRIGIFSTESVTVGSGPAIITQKFTIWGDGGIVYQVTGITGVFLGASDSFFYIDRLTGAPGGPSHDFQLGDGMTTFPTATPPPGGFLGNSGQWLISHDGSVRFPVIGVTNHPILNPLTYETRFNLEQDQLPGMEQNFWISGQHDCIKSGLDYSPTAVNPDFQS